MGVKGRRFLKFEQSIFRKYLIPHVAIHKSKGVAVILVTEEEAV